MLGKVLALSIGISFHRSFQTIIMETDLSPCRYMCWGYIPVLSGAGSRLHKCLAGSVQAVRPPAEHGSSSLPTRCPFLLMEARMWKGEGEEVGRSGPDLQSGHGQTLCWDTGDRRCSPIPQCSHGLLWLTGQCRSNLSRVQFCNTNEKYLGNSSHGKRDTFKIITI